MRESKYEKMLLSIIMEQPFEIHGWETALASTRDGDLYFVGFVAGKPKLASEALSAFPLKDVGGDDWWPCEIHIIDTEFLVDAVEALALSDTGAKINNALSLVDQAVYGEFPYSVDVDDDVKVYRDGILQPTNVKSEKEAAEMLAIIAQEEFVGWM